MMRFKADKNVYLNFKKEKTNYSLVVMPCLRFLCLDAAPLRQEAKQLTSGNVYKMPEFSEHLLYDLFICLPIQLFVGYEMNSVIAAVQMHGLSISAAAKMFKRRFIPFHFFIHSFFVFPSRVMLIGISAANNTQFIMI